MLSGTKDMGPWVWIVINAGENRLEYNNKQKETRRHRSYSNQNDKWKTLKTDEDVLNHLLAALERDAIIEAIKKLELQQQELVYDVFYRGLSMAEVARRDGVNNSSVSRRMTRIFKQLKKNLKI